MNSENSFTRSSPSELNFTHDSLVNHLNPKGIRAHHILDRTSWSAADTTLWN